MDTEYLICYNNHSGREGLKIVLAASAKQAQEAFKAQLANPILRVFKLLNCEVRL